MKALSRIEQRLLRSAVEIEAAAPEAITYQHTVFCQTGLPYRDPGAAVRDWQRRQGNIALQVSAGQALHPERGEWVSLGIPFGPKPRLILTCLNREALLSGSPLVAAGDSLTSRGHLDGDFTGRPNAELVGTAAVARLPSHIGHAYQKGTFLRPPGSCVSKRDCARLLAGLRLALGYAWRHGGAGECCCVCREFTLGVEKWKRSYPQ